MHSCLQFLQPRRQDDVTQPGRGLARHRLADVTWEDAALTGHVAVVSGAGRAEGREVALALAAQGVHLALLDLDGAPLRALADEIDELYGVPVLAAAVDVGDPAALARIVGHVEQRVGGVDILVNVATAMEASAGPMWSTDPAATWGVVVANVGGALSLGHALLGQMVKRGHGCVVTVVAVSPTAAVGASTGHAVSCAALSVLTRVLSAQLAGTGVVALDVLARPGGTATFREAVVAAVKGRQDEG